MERKKPHIVLVLCDIRSAFNVGAMFRTADAAGVEKIFLVGTTPAPIDRFGRPVKDILKTALGAEKTVPWESFRTFRQFFRRFHELDHGIAELVALEQSPRAENYARFVPKFPFALVVGNEVTGIPKKILEKCDRVIEIPMRGKKESLNASVALGIALFRLAESVSPSATSRQGRVSTRG